MQKNLVMTSSSLCWKIKQAKSRKLLWREIGEMLVNIYPSKATNQHKGKGHGGHFQVVGSRNNIYYPLTHALSLNYE